MLAKSDVLAPPFDIVVDKQAALPAYVQIAAPFRLGRCCRPNAFSVSSTM
jgi:hypothetical protein